MTLSTRKTSAPTLQGGARKWLLAAGGLVLTLGLTGCGVGQPGTFGKVLQPGWLQTDFDGDGKKDLIAQTNLADVVFNPQGEIIGWFVKVNPGAILIRQNQNGQYDFSALNSTTNTMNLVGGRNGPDNKPLLVSGRRGLEVRAEGIDPKAPVAAQPPKFDIDIANNRMSATFSYQQGGVSVTKTVQLHPKQFNIQANVNVVGADRYTVNFAGLGRESNPVVKVLPQGVTTPTLGPSTVPNAAYAALQGPIGGLFHNSQTSPALLVRPRQSEAVQAQPGQRPTQQEKPTGTLNVTTLGGTDAQLSLSATGALDLEVYGGKNELIHLFQEGYTQHPGVFDPNFFGHISLAIAKIMLLLYSLVHNWGLTILLLTVMLRLLIWPLMQSQGRTTAKMQMVQPLMKELQDKYKDDPATLQAETMRLYRDYDVNPAGCLSMFIPLPILFVLYGTIRNFEFDSGLWWLPDLSIPDPFWILGILYVCANLLQLYVSTRKTPQMFQQQAMMYVFFAYFALTFPAGVTLYWIISTLIGTAQQFLINKQVEGHMAGGLQTVERVAPAVTIEQSGAPKRNASAPSTGRPGFRELLEKAAQQAAEQQRQKPPKDKQ